MKEVNKYIGGYFGLETSNGKEYHQTASESLNTARNCLEYILKSRKYSKIYLPYYMCKVLLEPIKKIGINYTFYELDNKLEPIISDKINIGEALLYINYFGLKQNTVIKFAKNKSIPNLIIDNSQAFFAPPILKENIDTFYSARKFFGVPDGAYLYTTKKIKIEEISKSSDKCSHLLKRIDNDIKSGYIDFQKNENKLVEKPIMKMSYLTKKILRSIDYERVKSIRINNYKILEKELSCKNKISLILEKDSVPMIYPYYTEDLNLRGKLIENNIFVAKYWPDIKEWSRININGINFADHIIPLPIDQRYSEVEMDRIISFIKK